MKEKLVYSSTNTIEIDHICSILKENNIVFIKKAEGAGDYLNIVAGNLFNNTIRIFVDEQEYEKVTELINSINSINESQQSTEIPEELKGISEEEEKEMNEKAKKTKGYLKLCIIFFIFLPVIIAIIVAIITNFSNK